MPITILSSHQTKKLLRGTGVVLPPGTFLIQWHHGVYTLPEAARELPLHDYRIRWIGAPVTTLGRIR